MVSTELANRDSQSLKSRPCLRRFASRLLSSHSKITALPLIVVTVCSCEQPSRCQDPETDDTIRVGEGAVSVDSGWIRAEMRVRIGREGGTGATYDGCA